MKRTTTKVLLAGLAAACLTTFSAPASAQATLDAVKKRGKLICGVSQVSAGFAFPDSKGVMQGFDVDICRAVSAAIFGSGDKVDFLATNINTRFQVLQSGEIDILSRQTTQTFSRDNSLGLDFGPAVFYDGQGLMVPKKLNLSSAKDLDGAAICVLPGTTTLQNLSDFFRTNNKKFESVVFENTDENRNAFFTGRCDATSSDRSDLASIRAVANNPADYVVLPETISKEPLAPVVRQGDSNWRDILNWTVYTLYRRRGKRHHQGECRPAAEERGSRDPAHAGRHRRFRQDDRARQQVELQHHQERRQLQRSVRAQPRRKDAAGPHARTEPALDEGRPALFAAVPLI